jgi:ribosome-dependent ATPase
MGTPADLVREQGAATLEDAFITVLEAEAGHEAQPVVSSGEETLPSESPFRIAHSGLFGWLAFTWAFARREGLELLRDPLRLGFALAGPLLLLAIAAYSISFDVNDVRLLVVDHDRSASSRELVRHFEGSRYFRLLSPDKSDGADDRMAERSMIAGRAQMVLDIPPGFGRDLAAGRHPDLGVQIEGSSPFPASNARAYADAILTGYQAEVLAAHPETIAADPALAPANGAGVGQAGLPLGWRRAFPTIRNFAASMPWHRACSCSR